MMMRLWNFWSRKPRAFRYLQPIFELELAGKVELLSGENL